MKQWKLWVLTVCVIFLALFIAIFICPDETSALGSILAAASGFVAVIWFYSSLQLQSIQLAEQREQFKLEFDKLNKEAKRSSLLFARETLNDMERRVNEQLKGLGNIYDLPLIFLNNIFSYIKPIVESDDPRVVQNELIEAMKILIPAKTFLSSLKEAASIILENEDIKIIGDDNKPEWFIITYEKYLENRPFISRYLGTARLLSDFMARVKLELIEIAFTASAQLNSPSQNILTDKAIKDMIEFRKKNSSITPKIVERCLDSLTPEQKKRFGI